MTTADRMTALAESFPSLHGKRGIRPWEPEVFMNWLEKSPEVTSGSGAAGKFICHVWNHYFNGFDLSELHHMDNEHLAAWQAWAADPWWA